MTAFWAGHIAEKFATHLILITGQMLIIKEHFTFPNKKIIVIIILLRSHKSDNSEQIETEEPEWLTVRGLMTGLKRH